MAEGTAMISGLNAFDDGIRRRKYPTRMLASGSSAERKIKF